ncbi:MAG TPA: hypothetical protein VL921_15525 [Candidatus Udaeobacter sp.]|nr:hypothetical protein [Candidatus Udaeobacter sp.]
MRGCLKMDNPHETKTMKKWNKSLIIIAGALVVIGIALYGGISLYAKLNKVTELHTRLDEAAGKPETKPTQEHGQEEQGQGQEQEQEASQETSQESLLSPSEVPQLAPAAALTPDQPSDNADEGQKPVEDAASAEDKVRKKNEIDASVTAKLWQLRSSCQARSSSLAGQIAQELRGDEEATAAAIQSKYMDMVFSAEADCDARFNQMISIALSEYKAAGLGDQSLPDWSSQYESAKAEARADALDVIANSLN